MKRALIIFTAVMIAIFLYSLWQSWYFYRYLQKPTSSFSLDNFEQHDQMGYSLKSSNEGYYYFQDLSKVPIYTDGERKRVPRSRSKDSGGKQVFFVGDSFTFGDGVPAEFTFPYLLERAYGLRIENLAVSGYNYAHSLYSIETAISMADSGAVFCIQLSPWLNDRSVTRWQGSFFKIGVPYLIVDENFCEIHDALFHTRSLEILREADLTLNYIGKKSMINFCSFYFNVGLPIFIQNIYAGASLLFHGDEAAERQPEDVLNCFLNKIDALLGDENVAFYNIGYMSSDFSQIALTNTRSNWVFIDLELALKEKVANEEIYQKTYYHWNTDTNILFDRHFNATAHAICAKALMKYDLLK
jgi:hypothetical protein